MDDLIGWVAKNGSIFLLALVPALLTGLVAGWLGPIITARRSERLWLLQQRLEIYATVVDYASMIFRLVDTFGSRLPHEGQLPKPPELMEGRLKLLGTFPMLIRWQNYSGALHSYNVNHAQELGRNTNDLMTSIAIAGNNLTAQCDTEMRNAVFTKREIRGLPFWQHWCHVKSENHPWLKRFVPESPYDPGANAWSPPMAGQQPQAEPEGT